MTATTCPAIWPATGDSCTRLAGHDGLHVGPYRHGRDGTPVRRRWFSGNPTPTTMKEK